MAAANREWVFQSRPGPAGFTPSDFELRECPNPDPLAEGELLLGLHLLSMDPTMRNAMAGAEAAERTEGSKYYEIMNWQPGTVVSWSVVAQVLESRDPAFSQGDLVLAWTPWRELVKMPASKVKPLPEGATASAAMSTLGMTARTAYLGAKFIGEPRAGDVAYVSGAAGATGLIACQTLKYLGCRVVGSAGSDEKVDFLKGLGIEAFNYKVEAPLVGLRRLCPDGVNVAFDNVGGETLEAILELMNDKGRIVLCGAISQYDTPPEKRYGVRNLFHIVAKQLKMQGFVFSMSFTEEQNADCTATLAAWLKEGKTKDLCTFVDGFEKLPEGILTLFSGANQGKTLVRVPLREISK